MADLYCFFIGPNWKKVDAKLRFFFGLFEKKIKKIIKILLYSKNIYNFAF